MMVSLLTRTPSPDSIIPSCTDLSIHSFPPVPTTIIHTYTDLIIMGQASFFSILTLVILFDTHKRPEGQSLVAGLPSPVSLWTPHHPHGCQRVWVPVCGSRISCFIFLQFCLFVLAMLFGM